MKIKEALDYVNGTRWRGAEASLRRIRELMSLLGDPQKKLRFVHIAGTNGKGSCAAMTASVLRACGYRTGLYTSPYLYRFNERMQVNGEMIEDEALCRHISAVRDKAEKMDEHPTEFELMTAAAMLYFLEEKCDIVVLEVGLGGRFDATNVVDTPECSIIMNIGLDHTAILGGTVEEIAAEKAGIIKKNCPCVLYEQKRSVMDVVAERCRELDAPLTTADFSAIEPVFDSLEGQAFRYKGAMYALPLLGAHQLRNAAVVLETVGVLRARGWRLEDGDVEHGLYATSWPGRFELCAEEPDFIVDGGHNPQCAETVAENLMHYFPDNKRVLLIGVLRDKDYEKMTEILAPCADEFVTVAPDSPRALSAEELAGVLSRFSKPVTPCASVAEAVDTAKELAGEDGMVCASGSLYLVGSVRYALGMY